MQTTRVIAHDFINDDTIMVRLELPKNPGSQKFTFKPGQFITIDVGNNQSRSYSMCSSPSIKDYIEICVKIIPEGIGSAYIQKLKPGDEVSIKGPFGAFVLQENDTPNLLFISNGMGIMPIYAMLQALAEQKSAKNIRLLFGAYNEASALFIKRLNILKKDLPNFSYTVALSDPTGENRLYYTGKVTNYLKKNYNLNGNWNVYICGSQQMECDIRKILTDHNFPPEKISAESFH